MAKLGLTLPSEADGKMWACSLGLGLEIRLEFVLGSAMVFGLARLTFLSH